GLAVNQTYSQSQTFLLPPAFTGRYHLFVRTDAGHQVFQNGQTAGNTAESDHIFDVMPLPYVDLVVSSVTVPAQAHGGLPLTVNWTVTNQGIGTTSTGEWNDVLYLATNADGSGAISGTEIDVDHFGFLGVGGSYTGSVQILVPNGLSGNLYV